MDKILKYVFQMISLEDNSYLFIALVLHRSLKLK